MTKFCYTHVMTESPKIRSNRGFTLIEMLVVVMILGIMAAIGTPQYFKVVERTKTKEAMNTFHSLKGAQDRYFTKYGVYCNTTIAACTGLDIAVTPLQFFAPVPAFAAGGAGNQSWTLTLTRANTVALYGAYTLTYDVEPAAAPALTCSDPNCTTDLLPSN